MIMIIVIILSKGDIMTISDAPAGASFTVRRVLSGGEVGKRLADMGFTDGAEGAVVRAGLMRGLVQVRIRGYDLVLRHDEAERIEVEELGDWSAAADARWDARGRFWRRLAERGREGFGRRGGRHGA
jgi:ferrous iron transport protein A